jgi:hypothetical protein
MTAKTFTKVLYYQKFLGIALITIGIPISIISKSENMSMLIVGLFVLFTSFDKIMDERLYSLKATSMYIAIIFSYTFKHISTELARQHVVSYEMTNIDHFILMIFAVANITYFSRILFSTSNRND